MAAAPMLVCAETVLPDLVEALEDALPAALADRATADAAELEAPVAYMIAVDEERASERRVCMVIPRPEQSERREWQTPQADEGIACDVVVVYQARSESEAELRALGWQHAVRTALTRIGRAASVQGVWLVRLGSPLARQIGDDRHRRAAGYQAVLWTRVTREET
jgi:hypothetical protein